MVDVVWCSHQWGLSSLRYGIAPVSQVAGIRALPWIACLIGECVEIRVESFVHPGVAALVGPDNHGKPFVPMLVIDGPEDRRRLSVTVVHHYEHRVFQSTDRSGDARRLWIGEREKELRVLSDRPLRLLGALLPGLSGFREFVVGLCQNSVPAGCIPSKVRSACPCDVVDIPCAEPPRPGARFRLSLRGSCLRLRDDLNYVAATCCRRQPAALFGG